MCDGGRKGQSGAFFAADLVYVEPPDLDRLRLLFQLVDYRIQSRPPGFVALEHLDVPSYHQRAVVVLTLLLDVAEVLDYRRADARVRRDELVLEPVGGAVEVEAPAGRAVKEYTTAPLIINRGGSGARQPGRARMVSW